MDMVADFPEQITKLKTFRCENVNEQYKLNAKLSDINSLQVIACISSDRILDNYRQIKMI